jgi:hypothetical protein
MTNEKPTMLFTPTQGELVMPARFAEAGATPEFLQSQNFDSDIVNVMAASEPLLAREWDTPEEDAAWKHL